MNRDELPEIAKQTFAITDDVSDKITAEVVESIKRSTSLLMVVLDEKVDPRSITSLLATRIALNIFGLAYNQEVLVEGRFPQVIMDTMQRKLDHMATDKYYQETRRAILRELKEHGIAIRTEHEQN